jgi:FlaA1/EpsC-like NDP-sugar epimerase
LIAIGRRMLHEVLWFFSANLLYGATVLAVNLQPFANRIGIRFLSGRAFFSVATGVTISMALRVLTNLVVLRKGVPIGAFVIYWILTLQSLITSMETSRRLPRAALKLDIKI